MTISAKILADSLHPNGSRLITYVLRYPRFIHAELMTHRALSKNASSSRAIPVAKFLSAMREEPAMPEVWYKNKPGMQGTELMTEAEIEQAKALIGIMRDTCAAGIAALDRLGLHKQTANRYGEPWHHISVICSATDWANFFALRDHPDAQPEFQILAAQMRDVYDASQPVQLKEGQYHLPYVADAELEDIGIESALKCSVARCARVSFNNHDGSAPNWVNDVKLHDKLMESRPLHASPAEHQACVLDLSDTEYHAAHRYRGNFGIGWMQYRKSFKHENVTEMPVSRRPPAQ